MRAQNVQEKYNIFMEAYNSGVMEYVPRYRPRKEGIKEWFNGRCAKAKEKRDDAWRKWKRYRNTRNKENFRKARNEYMKVRKEEERGFEKSIVEKCKEHPKLLHKFINRKIKSKGTIERLRGEHGMINDPRSMAELLNSSFQKVFTKESPFKEPQINGKDVHMEKIIVKKIEILKLMEELEEGKAMGPDGVSGIILKACREELLVPLFDIIKFSIASGTVPVEWKRAEVVPIYKNGKKEEPLNYRPVSLTSVVSKMCERVIKKRWTKFLENYGLISNKQFGFRKGRSCVTNLLSFYSRIIDKIQERDGWVDCIYLDLKKAFDKVPHQRLMWKLRNVGGVSGRLEEWMKDYLMEREMRTIVKGKKSEWRNVTSGVPQGSVLGPIMFLIYVNDMTAGLRSYMNMFADDAKIMRRVKNMEDCDKLQEDIDRIFEWSKDWQMEFNINKCHIMRMGKSKYRPCKEYKLGEDKIEEVSEERDLGVIIQNNLSPEKHINKLFGKTYSMLQSIGLSFHYLDEEMMKKILTTLIRPQLEYAAVIWSPYMKKHVKKIERIQRLGTRMIPGFKEIPYEERLKELELVTLEERRTRGDMITIYKIVNKIDILDREDLIKIDPSNYLRGHERRIKKDACTSDVKKYSFPHRGIEVWNGLRGEIVNATSVSQMKEHFDKYGRGDRT